MAFHILKSGGIALMAAFALAGCDAAFGIGDDGGVPLSELDLSGAAPTQVVLAGPDTVNISAGEFNIAVDGESEAVARMRFRIEDGVLAVMREKGEWGSGGGAATVRITMPAPHQLTLAGSGMLTSAELAGDADVTIAGSGTLETPAVEADKLDVTVAGSGTYRAAGHTAKLNLSLLGSGAAAMEGLEVDEANVTVAGSGDAQFASSGDVDATIVGSGDVAVSGSATCNVDTIGSGSLTCERVVEGGE